MLHHVRSFALSRATTLKCSPLPVECRCRDHSALPSSLEIQDGATPVDCHEVKHIIYPPWFTLCPASPQGPLPHRFRSPQAPTTFSSCPQPSEWPGFLLDWEIGSTRGTRQSPPHLAAAEHLCLRVPPPVFSLEVCGSQHVVLHPQYQGPPRTWRKCRFTGQIAGLETLGWSPQFCVFISPWVSSDALANLTTTAGGKSTFPSEADLHPSPLQQGHLLLL